MKFTQVRQQLDRLRNANTKLVAERDAAVARAVKAEESAAAQADEADAARVAMNQEVVRLTTTTEQQGKLINHLLSLLPAPERRRIVSTSSSDVEAITEAVKTVSTESQRRPRHAIRAGGFVRSRNVFWGGKTKTSIGHFALFPKNRSMIKGKKTIGLSNVHQSSVALGAANGDVKRKLVIFIASLIATSTILNCILVSFFLIFSVAFKSMIGLGTKRQSVDDVGSNEGDERSSTTKFQPPPCVYKRRMVAWMRNLSTLRSKHIHPKEVTDSRRKLRRLPPDLAGFSEDEGEYDLAGGVYMGDSASLDFPAQESEYAISDVDYLRRSVSTASSGRSPSLQSYPEIATRTAIWSQHMQASSSNAAEVSHLSSYGFYSSFFNVLIILFILGEYANFERTKGGEDFNHIIIKLLN